jgi:chloride channel 7
MIILACIGGYLGCLFTSFNTWVCLVRKRWSKHMGARVAEVCVISVITSTVRFISPAMGTCKPCETTDTEHCISGGPPGVELAFWDCWGV